MAINETIGLTASFTTAGGKVLSRRAPNVTINDTSNYNVVIAVTKDWLTTASESKYGTLYVKPTINIADEIIKRYGRIDSSMRCLITIAADVAVVGDNENVGALYADSRIPASLHIQCDCHGLLLGRGGRAPMEGYPSWGLMESGQNGGPAVSTVYANIYVTVYGGLSGGGGGGGGRGSHWNSGYYNTDIREWWDCAMYQPTSGSGAPFGLRMGTHQQGWCGAEQFIYENSSVVGGVDEAPTAAIRVFEPGQYSLDGNRSVTIIVNPLTNRIRGYSDGADGLLVTLDIPVKQINSWMTAVKDRTPSINTLRWTETIYENDHLIREDRAYLHGIDRYARNTGAIVPNTGQAGLFRGANGALSGRVNTGYMSRFLCCSSQAVVDRIGPGVTGEKGGDIGESKGLAAPLEPNTIHSGYYGGRYQFEILEGFVGKDHQTGKPNSEVLKVIPPTRGGYTGDNYKNTNSGRIQISAAGGGALGGPAVLAKYDPNADFDTKARGSNVLKTFKPKWYVHS